MAGRAARAGGVAAALASVLIGTGLAADQGTGPGDGTTVKARTHLVVGEVVRIDPRRHLLVVKTAESPPREIEITVEAATRVTAGGRTRSLEEVRPGSRVSITCADGAGGGHLARLVTVRAAPAAPVPSAGASPKS